MKSFVNLELNEKVFNYQRELYPGEEVLWKGVLAKTNEKKRLILMCKGTCLLIASIALPIPICNMFEPYSAFRLILALTVLFGTTIGILLILIGVFSNTYKYVLTSYRLLCLDGDLNVVSRRSFDIKHISSVTETETYLQVEFKPPSAINTPTVRISNSTNGYDILKKHFYNPRSD